MTRDDILEAVVQLCAGSGAEADDIALVTRLRQALPHAKISDLIFHDFRELTPEEVVDEAMRREAAWVREPGSL